MSLGISDQASSMTSGTQHRRLDESAEGNAPSAEDTFRLHGGKGENGQKGGRPERPWMGAQKESKTSGMKPIVLPSK